MNNMARIMTAKSSSRISVTEGSPQERWFSVFVGVILFFYGLSRLSVTAITLILGGLYLIYRGSTGKFHDRLIWMQFRAFIDGLSTGREFSNEPPPAVEEGDLVSEASWESFPTSDAPAWTMGRDREE